MIYYLNISKSARLTGETKQEFYFSPVKMAGIIAVVAVVSNLTLLIVLQREISLWGWSIRGLFLLLGSAGLFCNTDWQAIRNSSVILKLGSRKPSNHLIN